MTQFEDDHPDSNPAQGIAIGCLLGLVGWAIVGLLFWLWWKYG